MSVSVRDRNSVLRFRNEETVMRGWGYECSVSVRDSGSNARYKGLGYECVVKGGV